MTSRAIVECEKRIISLKKLLENLRSKLDRVNDANLVQEQIDINFAISKAQMDLRATENLLNALSGKKNEKV